MEFCNMKISVIVPIYNTELYMRKCLDSIVNQTYPNLEIILINDGSTDSSLSIIQEYAKTDNRIIVIDQPNGGQSRARNAALDIMTGDYLSFVDSDDWLDLNTFKAVMNLFSASTDADMIAFPVELVYEDGRVKPRRDSFAESFVKKYDYKLSEKIFHGISIFSVWGRIFKSSIFQNIRFPEGRIYEDVGIFPDIDRKLRVIGYSTIGKYYYYQREGSSMNTPSILNINFIKMRMEMSRKLLNYLYLEKGPAVSKKVLQYEYGIIVGMIRSYSGLNFRKKCVFYFYLLKFIAKGKASRFVGRPLKHLFYYFSKRRKNPDAFDYL